MAITALESAITKIENKRKSSNYQATVNLQEFGFLTQDEYDSYVYYSKRNLLKTRFNAGLEPTLVEVI